MKLNGKDIELKFPISLLDILKQNGYQISNIAVELNGDISPKSGFSEVMICNEDTIEVVSFVGGG